MKSEEWKYHENISGEVTIEEKPDISFEVVHGLYALKGRLWNVNYQPRTRKEVKVELS